jgi:hypothetical protein
LARELQNLRIVWVLAVTKKKEPERAREVLEYFFRNPQAADTLEGVTRWRLLRETVHRHVEETAEAFEWLVAEGFLNETLTTYSKPIYSFNTEATAKAEHFLGQEKTPPQD